MARSQPPTRVLTGAAALVLCACLLAPSYAFAGSVIAKAPAEHQPLRLSAPASSSSSSSGGASLVRTIVGLAIVLAVIWGITWLLRQVKASKGGVGSDQSSEGLATVAALTLGSGRSVHLVRAGSDYVLVGVAERGVVPVHRYTEQEARQAGLLGLGASNPMLADDSSGSAMEIPGQPLPANALERLRRWTVRP